ncbi:hypothetical protein U1Q18_001058 [Sarracenia purpurea var. burkii]
MPKSVSGEDKVTPGDPKGSEEGSEEDDGEDEESDEEQTEDEDDFGDEELIEPKAVVFECGPNCGCGPGCVNRTSQRGLRYGLEVFRTSKKGWGVRSWDFIPSGAPVCEYTGTLMRTDEIDSAYENNYIFYIDCLQTIFYEVIPGMCICIEYRDSMKFCGRTLNDSWQVLSASNTIVQATALLQKNLENARASLEVLVADLQLRDQLEIIQTMKYLHHDYSISIVQCDLKSSNVLLDQVALYCL